MVKLNVCARGAAKPVHEQTEDPRVRDLDEPNRSIARAALTALASGVVLDVKYEGLNRLVEVHAVGISTKGMPVMRVYQLEAGQSHSGAPSPWRLLSISKIEEIPQLVDVKSLAPREGYRKGDKGMCHIFAEL